jgi:hypothetical protein
MDKERMAEPDPRRTTPGPDGAPKRKGDDISAGKRQKEQQPYVENEGLTKKRTREATDTLGGVEGEDLGTAREAAAQRGRTAN